MNEPEAREVPLMSTAPPSATKLLRSAALTTLETTGWARTASKVEGNTVKPEVVRADLVDPAKSLVCA